MCSFQSLWLVLIATVIIYTGKEIIFFSISAPTVNGVSFYYFKLERKLFTFSHRIIFHFVSNLVSFSSNFNVTSTQFLVIKRVKSEKLGILQTNSPKKTPRKLLRQPIHMKITQFNSILL